MDANDLLAEIDQIGRTSGAAATRAWRGTTRPCNCASGLRPRRPPRAWN